MRKYLLFFVLILSLVSCATFYKPLGFSGGYSSTTFDKNLFRVSFSGNGFTSLERALDFAFLRSAELCWYRDFKYFVIVDSSTYISNSLYITPTTIRTSGEIRFYPYSNYASISARSRTYGGQIYNISKPKVMLVILCFEERPDLEATIFNAEYIKESVRSKYNIKRR